ncbi:TetR/AcrR family transcriptional regulator [Paraburkholderia lycopersici]|uniref:Regulatory protein, tetR family n=1 Tax=Paraburkholderia lycopersici TaxID=416944 RepID=A0A1G6L444_9BURK|nr:TetR/AcrR family transcriptional regulator [Paraburkholderia lycopersici]SDC38080.1 regulatory protein, tetR family [Paraburkholderia lycopersici]
MPQLTLTAMDIAGRKDRATRAHDQRERIVDAARRIVLREGLAALSMRKIAEAIGYSPASLYLYFEGRDEIAEALGREGYAQLLAYLEPHACADDARERLHALAHAYVAFGCDHPQTYELIFMMHRGRQQQAGPHAHRQRDAASKPPASDARACAACGAQLFAATLSELILARGAHADCGLLAEALWATLHGVVMLTLARAEFAPAAPGPLIEAALDAWFGERAAATLPPAQTSGAASC